MDKLEKLNIEQWVIDFKKKNNYSEHRTSVEMNCVVSAATINKLIYGKYISDRSYLKIKEWILNHGFEI